MARLCYPKGLISAPVTPDGGAEIEMVPWPVIPPFTAFRPASAKDFYGTFSGVIAAVIGSTTLGQPSAAFGVLQIPNGAEAVLTDLSIGVLNSLATIDLRVSIRADGTPIAGLSALRPWPAAGALVAKDLTPWTWIQGPATLDVEVTNLAATGPWTVLVDLSGYLYATPTRTGIFGADGSP